MGCQGAGGVWPTGTDQCGQAPRIMRREQKVLKGSAGQQAQHGEHSPPHGGQRGWPHGAPVRVVLVDPTTERPVRLVARVGRRSWRELAGIFAQKPALVAGEKKN